ncbi:MAG TPA: STAS domain-containing protein [Rhodocyclaceae bacterium]
MSFATTTQDGCAVISVPARFDFRLMQDFHAAMDDAVAQRPGSEIVVDLGGTDYLDSSALGMLLVLRDRARHQSKSVVLARARGSVGNLLRIANFGKLFDFR